MTLSARNLSVTADGRRIVDAVDLDIVPGEVVAVAGPNGAGKSTLLRALAGVGCAHGFLRGGEVTIDGRLVADMDARDRGRAIAFLPQERIVHWPLAVERVVTLGRLPHGGAGASADRAAVEAALAATDVVHLRHRPVTALSGGERARVLLARALAQEARVLVADEPAAGLDPAHALDLFGQFARLAAAGRSVVVALHDLSLARRFCHRLVLVEGGRVRAAGPPAEVLTSDTLAAVYGIRAVIGEIDGIPVVVATQPLSPRGAK